MKKNILLQRQYQAPIAQVWTALTDAHQLSQWLMPCDIQPVVGHKFTFQTKPSPRFDGTVHCEVLEVIPEQLLVFSWSGGPLKNTKVSFRLTALAPNQTQLDFEHSGFEGLLQRLVVRNILAQGWKGLLSDNLQKLLQHG